MEKRPSSVARTLAVLALVGSFIVVVVVVSAALSNGGSAGSGNSHAQQAKHREEVHKQTPATYVIKSGDTLTAIAHATGVGVAKIERLNPEVDPQILIAGERLKLK
ncbi:MAG: LysM peptidoglycan-binding domain-containing protein [Solirubrobacterales bacterium]